MFSQKKPLKSKTGVLRKEKCPVPGCPSLFGTRFFYEKTTWECYPCHADFTFHPMIEKPTAVPWSQKVKPCNCGRHKEDK